ncbi:integrase catalytic domain-containing protein [Pedobacter panaciterrae]
MTTINRRYHSEIKEEYTKGQLPFDIVKTIPRSTRKRWREQADKAIWMPIPVQHNITDELTIRRLKAENIILKKKIKALFYLVLLYKDIVSLLPMKSYHVLKFKKGVELLLHFCFENRFDKLVWRLLPFSFKQWHSWNGLVSCRFSLQGYCRKQNVTQLSFREQEDLELGCAQKEIRNWPLISVYYYLLRQKKINFSIGAFYKYCRLLKITRRKYKRRKKYVPIAASSPLKILHQDITIIKTLNGMKHYVYIIKDNFSKAILACKVTTEYSSMVARETFEGVLRKFGLLQSEGFLITDGGSENKGYLEDYLHKPGMLWKKLTAQLDIVQSNSMIEAANRMLKQRYLLPKSVYNTTQLKMELEHAITNLNSMPSGQLFGYSPNEVLDGAVPDRSRFRQQIFEATTNRMQENRNFNCKLTCHA